MRTNLQRHELEVAVAASGHDALAQFDLFHPDVVLLDLGLPDTGGFDVIHALRERTGTPIVVLSVRGAERDKVPAAQLLARNLLIYGVGGIIASFIGIKIIHVLLALLHLA